MRTIATIRSVADTVADYYNVPLDAIVSMRRDGVALRARSVAIWLCRTAHSQSAIGRFFGDRDHSTISSIIKNFPARMQTDPDLAYEVHDLELQTCRATPAPAERPLRLQSQIDPIIVARRIIASPHDRVSISLEEALAMARALTGQTSHSTANTIEGQQHEQG